MKLQFLNSNNRAHFRLTAKCFLALCGKNFTTDVIPQNFSTPFYPRLYSNGISCEWIITTPVKNQTIILVFFKIETEECCDHIKVSDLYAIVYFLFELLFWCSFFLLFRPISSTLGNFQKTWSWSIHSYFFIKLFIKALLVAYIRIYIHENKFNTFGK